MKGMIMKRINGVWSMRFIFESGNTQNSDICLSCWLLSIGKSEEAISILERKR